MAADPETTTTTDRGPTATTDRPAPTEGFVPFRDEERREIQDRWTEIEARFVDDPAGATRSADDLVSETMDRLTRRWQEHRAGLRAWDRDGDGPSTEELRTTLKRYRGTLEQLIQR